MKHVSYIDEHCVQFSQDRTILEHCPPDFMGIYTIPDSVTEIGDDAFSFCRDLTAVKIPSSVTQIGDMAFHMCTNLTSIIIPPSVTIIKDDAFSQCFRLNIIEIPSSVTKIGSGAFDSCLHTSVRIHHTNPDQVEVSEFTFLDCAEHSRLFVPKGTAIIYRQHPVFGQFRTIFAATDEEWTSLLPTL